MANTQIGFHKVQSLPEWNASLDGSVYFVPEDGIYVATSTGFQLQADVTSIANLNVAIYPENATGVTFPYAASTDQYTQNGFCIIPDVASEADVDAWYKSEHKQVTLTLAPEVLPIIMGSEIAEMGSKNVELVCSHSMDINAANDESSTVSAMDFYYYSLELAHMKPTGYFAISAEENTDGSHAFSFTFDYTPAQPIIVDVVGNSDGGYDSSTPQTAEYCTKYITSGGRDILLQIHNANTNAIIGSSLVHSVTDPIISGDTRMLCGIAPTADSSTYADALVVVSVNGGTAYIERSAALKSYVDDRTPKIITVDSLPATSSAIQGALYFVPNSGVYTLGTSNAFERIASVSPSSAVTPIEIFFPANADPTDMNIGLQGEKTIIYTITGDDFYNTVGIDKNSPETVEEYYERLRTNLVFINGCRYDHDGNPMIHVPYIQLYDTGEIYLTAHRHLWAGGNDGQVADSVADLVCAIDINNETVSFILTQWDTDEMHMALPYKIEVYLTVDPKENTTDDTVISIQLRDYNKNNVTSKYVLDLMAKGYRVDFGSWDGNTWKSVEGKYDTWAFSDDQLVLRWANIGKGKSVGNSNYYTHSYSVLVFDKSGLCRYNDTQDLPIAGYAYAYKPIQGVICDDFISASIAKDSAKGKHMLSVTANTLPIYSAVDNTKSVPKFTCTSATTGTMTLTRYKTGDGTYPAHPWCWQIEGTNDVQYTDTPVAASTSSITLYTLTDTWYGVNVTITETFPDPNRDGLVMALDAQTQMKSLKSVISSNYNTLNSKITKIVEKLAESGIIVEL